MPSSSASPSSASGSLPHAQRIVDTLHEPLLVLDDALMVCQVNPAFYRTFGTTPEATLGTCLYALGNGHFDQSLLRSCLDAVVAGEGPFQNLELDQTVEGLGRRVLSINGRRLGAEADDAARILLAIQDITEQRTLEETLRRRSRRLERSNADLEQFAYAASHDLQEPLRMVSSYLQLLERRYKDALDTTAREFIEYAVDGAERMKSLIDGLLQYSRVGRKEGEITSIDLTAVVDEIRTDLGASIERLEATITRGALPTLRGTRPQIRRLLQNLIENALTYHGDRPPRIHISAKPTDDDTVHLAVHDDGPGIPPDAQEKVFQIFKQLDPHGAGAEGSGIGLALCRKIAERHNGTLWVDSTPGDGSTFHVTLSSASPTA